MKNLNFKEATAWMVRRDGKVIPVVQHIYGNPLDVEETLFAAEWLYENTSCRKTRLDIGTLVYAWVLSISEEGKNQSILPSVRKVIESRPYRFVTFEFVKKIVNGIRESDAGERENVEKCCRSVVMDLNEEFLRVRFGGMYYTESENRKLYFRVSSGNFDWSNVIADFLEISQLDYEEYHVVIDEESCDVNPEILQENTWLESYLEMP